MVVKPLLPGPVILFMKTMKVEIWSDVMCPFCYIGKRRFETALQQFPAKENIEVVWKSFQLNPHLVTDPGKHVDAYLSETKRWAPEYTRQVNAQVSAMAKAEGLQYNFDQAIVANSFDAHRLLQYAKQQGKGDEMEESLFRSYFTDGKNIADHQVLASLAGGIGLDPVQAASVLAGTDFTSEVEQDIYEARQIGVNGVPYFVFNDRYAVSGAQAAETFLGALNKSWSELAPQLTTLADADAPACKPGEDCS